MALPKIPSYPLPHEHDIPQARVPWRVDRSRAALLIHDMQNYFLNAFAPLDSPLPRMVEHIDALAAHARALDIPVFYSCQSGNQDPRDRGLQSAFWGPGMSCAVEHQAITEHLRPARFDIVLTKHRYSAFQRTNLETLMRVRGRDQLIICGVYAHIGCLLTAAEAFQRDIEPFFVADALGDFSREKHDFAVRYVAERCGVAMTAAQVRHMLQ